MQTLTVKCPLTLKQVVEERLGRLKCMQGHLLVVIFCATNCKVKLFISGQHVAKKYRAAALIQWALRFVTMVAHGSFCSSKCEQFTITRVSSH